MKNAQLSLKENPSSVLKTTTSREGQTWKPRCYMTPSLKYNSLKIYISYFKWCGPTSSDVDLKSNSTKMWGSAVPHLPSKPDTSNIKAPLVLQHPEPTEQNRGTVTSVKHICPACSPCFIHSLVGALSLPSSPLPAYPVSLASDGWVFPTSHVSLN